ncbi:sugar epimerase [Polaribacter vadi]|uniref:Sugar epimerase n=1 Tax=Polaribacter vadi TaxID=1774273 RepID=A0A1B8TZ05_9FLAO|nr:WxcM-like domain-containing protein [Polaribacter vadi]AOW17243.1 sugar epimerase [Polaribacter vadi]OBY64830.1 sugar epimerase [Polaribacter vadi]
MYTSPKVIKGSSHIDQRGTLSFNNDFNTSEVKRVYFIENLDVQFIRGWQGHQIEQRWFSAVQGSFKIRVITIDNWETPSKNLESSVFILNSSSLDTLHIPKGYITSIQALEEKSKLMALSDYSIGEVNDEYRFDINYFK